jgi:D-alanine-D-alanine ligase
VPVVEGYFVNNTEDLKSILKDVVFPVFVKPNYEGSSKGITQKSICKDPEELLAYGQECIKLFPSGILIEKFIPGRDLSIPYIAGIGDQGVLEPLEYILKSSSENNIYDYDYKNLIDDHVEVRCPALLTPSQRALIVEMMKKVVSATGVVDFGRADFRITPDGDIYFLELNALPSLQPDAGLFLSSKLLGLDYNQTILKILEGAIARLKLSDKTPRTPRRIQTKIPKIGLVYNLKRKQAGEEGYENEAEFDSEKTVSALKSAIEKMNLPVIPIEATKTLSENLKEHKIDIVFNIAEGSNKRAREAQVPAICDLLGIEHTGSDATCLAITLDKAVTKKLLSQDGILTPNYRLYTGAKTFENGLKYPVIVKPNYEGTSKGIHQNSVATKTWCNFFAVFAPRMTQAIISVPFKSANGLPGNLEAA